MTIERLCNYCKGKLSGRPDKKFCSDQCRSKKNYALRANREISIVDDTNRRLKDNRDLLCKLYATGRRKIARVLFISKGIDLGVFTQIHCNGDGHLVFCCYDFGYAKLNDSEFQIFKLTV